MFTIRRKRSKLVVPALAELFKQLPYSQGFDKVIFSNTSPTVPISMTLGGGLSRGLGLDTLGVPLLIKGAKQCNSNIFALVLKTKEMAEQLSDTVIIIDNKEFKI